MRPKHKRLVMAVAGLALLGAAAALVLNALEDTVLFFHAPGEVADGKVGTGQPFRLGGLVEPGSVVRPPGTPDVHFRIVDGVAGIPVRYAGLLPDLFREGQGVVALGQLDPQGTFVAQQVLAKHDENYMPPEVAEALRRSGHWQGRGK